MANEKNLIPNSERTPEELREIAAAGGRASGAARRRRKSLREAADLYLSLPVKDKKTLNCLVKSGLESEDIDNQMAIIAGLSKKAMLGDSRSAKVLFDLLGEGAANETEGVQIIDDL